MTWATILSNDVSKLRVPLYFGGVVFCGSCRCCDGLQEVAGEASPLTPKSIPQPPNTRLLWSVYALSIIDTRFLSGECFPELVVTVGTRCFRSNEVLCRNQQQTAADALFLGLFRFSCSFLISALISSRKFDANEGCRHGFHTAPPSISRNTSAQLLGLMMMSNAM